MPFTNILRTLALHLSVFAVLALHAAEPANTPCDCDLTSCTSCATTMEAATTASDYSHFSSRYVEPYASVTKRNHDRLSSINTGLAFNQPLNANVDVGAFYGYSYLQDYTWVHTNTLSAAAFYHRTYGDWTPFASAQAGGSWDSFSGKFGFWSLSIGAEYQPAEKLVLSASAGMSDLFESGDQLGFFAGASASYWICRHAGPYATFSIGEHNFINTTVGIQTRFRF